MALYKKIWKYIVVHAGENEIEVPMGAQLVHCDNQHEKLCAWLLVDPNEQRMETIALCVVNTGQPIPMHSVGSRIHTVLLRGGTRVVHVFMMRGDG